MAFKPRIQLNRSQLEVLRQITVSLNMQNQAANVPGRYFLEFQQGFGVGKIQELASESDSNTWIAYRGPNPYDRPTMLTYWLEWLVFVYMPQKYGNEVTAACVIEIAKGMHPIDALAIAAKDENVVL